ncbi:hypothetical protein I540_4580 [Mycobacteroides abscessus subsp. bolletii 1513]|uniref:Uncharacterized protein n=1 Tax=Mycobacteroides abscessus subsp. bolletii 1513 TaxID=1299321 RepID=X8DE85_9MYCO|nr:hypothetical protein I540_4580 [Mycobacteroides abscessus subsp. bolletii 1513]
MYRRWPDVRTLVAELLTREMGSILPATGRGVRASGWSDR